jgi:predicted transcriptional regulator
MALGPFEFYYEIIRQSVLTIRQNPDNFEIKPIENKFQAKRV